MPTLQELLAQAQQLNNEEKYAAVIELLTNELLQQHNNADLYAEKAQAHYRLKEYDLCKEAVDTSLRTNESNAKAYNYRGNLLVESKESDKAIEAYQKAIELDPKYAYPYNGLGNAYYAMNQYDKAIEAYQKAIEIDPNDAYPYNGLGLVYHKLKQYEKAIQEYQKAIEIDPSNDSPYYNLGSLYRDTKNYDDAIYYYEEFLKKTKDGDDDFFVKYAKARIEELRKEKSNKNYRKVAGIIDEIKKLLRYREASVTHYTQLSIARILLFGNSPFRISEGTFLNDTSEGKELFNFLEYYNVKKPTKDTDTQQYVRRPFIGSFVIDKMNDDLTLWRTYGKEGKDDAKGCALTLDREKLLNDLKKEVGDKNDSIREEFDFYRVAYRTSDDTLFIVPGFEPKQEEDLNNKMQQLKEEINRFKTQKQEYSEFEQDIHKQINDIAYLFKKAAYQYENELRLVISGTGFDKIILEDQNKVFINLVPIPSIVTCITLGPKVEKADETAAVFHYLLDKQKLHPDIFISHLPYK